MTDQEMIQKLQNDNAILRNENSQVMLTMLAVGRILEVPGDQKIMASIEGRAVQVMDVYHRHQGQ